MSSHMLGPVKLNKNGGATGPGWRIRDGGTLTIELPEQVNGHSEWNFNMGTRDGLERYLNNPGDWWLLEPVKRALRDWCRAVDWPGFGDEPALVDLGIPLDPEFTGPAQKRARAVHARWLAEAAECAGRDSRCASMLRVMANEMLDALRPREGEIQIDNPNTLGETT